MAYIGRLKPVTESAEIDEMRWIKLIDSHGSLRHAPPVNGINPFTRQPWVFYAADSTAEVIIDGTSVGSIVWASDGSSLLFVNADDEWVDTVASIAEEIAKTLGVFFVRESEEE